MLAKFTLKSICMKTIAIVAGGYTDERIISLQSAEMILDHIDTSRYNAHLVVIDPMGWRARTPEGEVEIDKNDFSWMHGTSSVKVDGVFVIIHGTPGEDGILQGYFDLLNIPYTTGGVLAMSLSFSKAQCNDYLRANGFLTADHILIRSRDHYSTSEIVRELGLPIFVKPNRAGSSLATFKIDSKEGLHQAINLALEVDDEVILEAFLPGTEVTCGVIEVNGLPSALPPTEIVSEGEFFDYEAKYEGKSEEITPARISNELTLLVQDASVQIWNLMDFKGMIRADFMLHDGKPFLIEVNAVPGFSAASIIPQQAAQVGMSKTELITAIIEGSIGL